VLSVSPFVIRCGEGAVEVLSGQGDGGVTQSGPSWRKNSVWWRDAIRRAAGNAIQKARKKSVLILGVNGFIGNHLSERLLESGRYEVHGMDLAAGSLSRASWTTPIFIFPKGIFPFIGSGSSTMCANATLSCPWWPSPHPSNM
jgi:UDP-4-amino-4-deoxy-L-arabinose formyltransferase/UDP-glucuronic acid dehydrogenase (UDP-4-keto-hexauronic acid decarboxylating)